MFKSIKNQIRKKVITYLTNDVFKIVTVDNILQEKPDGLYLGGELMDPELETQLRDDAGKLLNSVLWEEVLEKPLQNDAC
ncbi:unnamed protein product, partial [marine sediment metagenome]